MLGERVNLKWLERVEKIKATRDQQEKDLELS